MKVAFLGLIAAGSLLAPIAGAQEPQPAIPPAAEVPQQPPPAQQPPQGPPAAPPAAAPQDPLPAVAAPAAPAVPGPLDANAFERRRKHISMVEGVLVGAVREAAQDMASRMQSPETGPFLLTGSLAARGFILDGYGVFFHVEIPGVQPSLMAMRPLTRSAQAENAGAGDARRGGPGASDADYVDAVTQALIEAMVSYSMPLELQPQEWFTVAAGDGDEPLSPGMLLRRATVILRIRGADIADYAAKRATLSEIRKKVEVQKF